MSNTSTVKTLPLVPFKEMPYTRPDMKAIEKGFADALSKFKAAASVKEQIVLSNFLVLCVFNSQS